MIWHSIFVDFSLWIKLNIFLCNEIWIERKACYWTVIFELFRFGLANSVVTQSGDDKSLFDTRFVVLGALHFLSLLIDNNRSYGVLKANTASFTAIQGTFDAVFDHGIQASRDIALFGILSYLCVRRCSRLPFTSSTINRIISYVYTSILFICH